MPFQLKCLTEDTNKNLRCHHLNVPLHILAPKMEMLEPALHPVWVVSEENSAG